LNGGQLAMLIRAQYLKEVMSFSKIQGRPLTIAEVESVIEETLS